MEKTLEDESYESSTLLGFSLRLTAACDGCVRVLGYLCRQLPQAAQWCQERVYSTGSVGPRFISTEVQLHMVFEDSCIEIQSTCS